MVDLREFAAALRIEGVEYGIIFFFDHSLFAVLDKRGAIAADMPLNAADTGEQIFSQFFEGGF